MKDNASQALNLASSKYGIEMKLKISKFCNCVGGFWGHWPCLPFCHSAHQFFSCGFLANYLLLTIPTPSHPLSQQPVSRFALYAHKLTQRKSGKMHPRRNLKTERPEKETRKFGLFVGQTR